MGDHPPKKSKRPPDHEESTNKTMTTAHNLVHKYQPTDKGPFVLHAVNIDQTPLKDHIVASALNRKNLIHNKVTTIINISPSKVKIICESSKSANQIINATQTEKFRIEIPTSFLYTEGLIKVPFELSLEEITNNIVCEAKIEKMERLTRWNFETQQAIPTNNIKITFRSFHLPRKVDIMCVPTRVSLFIPQPTLCKSCWRFGHTKKYCKAPDTCSICLTVHPGNPCPIPEQKCRYCPDSTHKTGNRDCPETIMQKKIKEHMIITRSSYASAIKDLRPAVQTENTQNSHNEAYPAITKTNNQLTSRIQELQNPNSNTNKINELKKENDYFRTIINEVMKTLRKANQEPLLQDLIATMGHLKTTNQIDTNKQQDTNPTSPASSTFLQMASTSTTTALSPSAPPSSTQLTTANLQPSMNSGRNTPITHWIPQDEHKTDNTSEDSPMSIAQDK